MALGEGKIAGTRPRAMRDGVGCALGKRDGFGSLNIRVCPLLVLLHDALVGLRAGVDLVLQRVQLQLADAIELIGRQRHVRHQCEQAHREERRGVVRGRDGGRARRRTGAPSSRT